MLNTDFEALGLTHGDRIWIVEADGQSNWGKYLGGYDKAAQTFVFGVDGDSRFWARVDLQAVLMVTR